MGFQHRFVPPALFPADPAHVYGTGHIGTVAPKYNTGIDHHESTPGYGLTGGAGGRAVGQTPRFPRRNDGLERHAVGSRLSRSIFQLSRDFRLPDPRAEA